MVNPNKKGCIGLVKAEDKQSAIRQAKGQFGLADCWVSEIGED